MSALASEQRDVILTRQCSIEGPNGVVSPLTITFLRPPRTEDRGVEAVAWLECEHFQRRERMYGEDELVAFVRLLQIVRISLENREGDGYSIWFYEKGDLQFFDFWTGSRWPQSFCLPSAYNGAAREVFSRQNAGKFLLPAHRVGIEPDRPAITIYKVNPDGSDRLGCVIGPEEIEGQTWESLAQLVGDRILWDSREGVEFMAALQPDRRPEPED